MYLEAVRCAGGPFGMKLPADARQLRTLAPLVREAVSEVEHWEGYTATRRTLHFDGLELGVIDLSNDPARLIVTHAQVTSPNWNRLLPFKLGAPVSAARAVLGEPAADDAALSRAYAGDGDSLQFMTSKGRLVGVAYRCYSG